MRHLLSDPTNSGCRPTSTIWPAFIDRIDYSAFGTVLDESSPSNGDRMMGFAGMERDTVTGMNLP
jgi:hypothetical protein